MYIKIFKKAKIHIDKNQKIVRSGLIMKNKINITLKILVILVLLSSVLYAQHDDFLVYYKAK